MEGIGTRYNQCLYPKICTPVPVVPLLKNSDMSNLFSPSELIIPVNTKGLKIGYQMRYMPNIGYSSEENRLLKEAKKKI